MQIQTTLSPRVQISGVRHSSRLPRSPPPPKSDLISAKVRPFAFEQKLGHVVCRYPSPWAERPTTSIHRYHHIDDATLEGCVRVHRVVSKRAWIAPSVFVLMGRVWEGNMTGVVWFIDAIDVEEEGSVWYASNEMTSNWIGGDSSLSSSLWSLCDDEMWLHCILILMT